MNQCTDMSWSYFLGQKSDLANTMIGFIKQLRDNHGKKRATIMRFDNAGENKSFESYLRKRIGYKILIYVTCQSQAEWKM